MRRMSEKPYLTGVEVAARFSVHENTVARWADQGILKAERTPTGRRRYRREDVEAFAAQTAGEAS